MRERDEGRSEELDLRRLIGTLYRHRWAILAFALAGLIASAVFAYFKPNIYSTSATVEVQVRNPWGWGRQDAVTSALTGGTVSNLDTELQIIRSRFVAAKALKKVDFSHRYYITKRFREIELYKASPIEVELTRGYGLPFRLYPLGKEKYRLVSEYTLGGEKKSYDAVHRFGEEVHTSDFVLVVRRKPGAKFTENEYRFTVLNPKSLPAAVSAGVRATPVSKTANLISISYQDTVPLRTQELVNALADAYLEQNIERRTREAEKTLEFINSQLKTLAENLKVSAANLEAFQRRTKTIDVDKKVERLSEKLGEYESQLATLKLQEEILSSLVKKVKRGRNLETLTLAGVGIEDESLSGLVADLRTAILKKKELLRDYTSAYPEVKKLDSRIRQLRQIIVQSVGNLYKSVREREKFLQKQMEKFRQELASLPEDQRNFLALQRRFASNEKFYSYLMEKKTETEIRKASTVSANRIVDRALYPGAPVRPKRKLIILIGLLLGLGMGIAYAFAREFIDDRVKNEEEIRQALKVPMLGTIPHFGKKSDDMVVFSDPKSAAAEAFRSIRTNLLFMSPREHGQVVAVTSTVGGEGKTTICINLGGIIALAGKKVIILNLDMRKPTLHKKFGLSNREGMSNLLSGHAKLSEVIQHSAREGLDIISSGPIPPNPSELIGGEILPEVIRVLRRHYDVVILDTPPIGLVTDARLVMRMADITAYILRAGHSRRPFFRNIEELYIAQGQKGMGIILNDFDPSRHGYGYGYGYGNGYGYGYYGESK
jgi:capsular exopolysaccharide synthesis family protein